MPYYIYFFILVRILSIFYYKIKPSVIYFTNKFFREYSADYFKIISRLFENFKLTPIN